MRSHCVFSQEAKRESPAGFLSLPFFFFQSRTPAVGGFGSHLVGFPQLRLPGNVLTDTVRCMSP